MTDNGSIIDPDRWCCLCDVGNPDYAAAVAIAADGTQHFVLAHRDSIGDPDVVYASSCPAAPHEQRGDLPLEYVRRITIASRRTHRCGRRTQAGRPCRIRVPAEGQACEWHRTKVDG